ncbi:MAG: 2-C-methyl-D-erythritol 2,4-cyclodiphosphate synthase [Calditrichia bacterium]
MRIGIGFDVHEFADDRPLVLGGVKIDYPRGLAGHSDADVLLHAISDALLGALALGDIGQHFPDDDPRYKNANSAKLLKHVYDLVRQEKYELNNLDAVIIAQKPKLQPYLNRMRHQISDIFWCDEKLISIKATTTEHLGFVGREEGIAAVAIVSLVVRQ